MKRKKRSVGNITAVDDDDLEESYDYYDTDDDTAAAANNKSFSESLKLFQSIQVLANEEERAALSDPSAADSKISSSEDVPSNIVISEVQLETDDYCFSSLMFSSVVGVVVVLLLMSGLSISLMCARLRRSKKEHKEHNSSVVHNTLR